MTWLALSTFVLVFTLSLARRRRDVFVVLPSETISTMHTTMSRRRTSRTKFALQAANEILH
ncbi:MAG TPA: hypothetical protein VF904_04800 [Anaeromyxobacteraceae bacterium]